MRILVASVILGVLGLAGTAAPAAAQGALVHGSVAAAVNGGLTSPAFAGGVAWRMNNVLGFGVELSRLPSLDSNFAHIYCCGDDEDTSATVFTTNVRVEIPTTSRRVIPFVVGGGGVAALTQSYSVIYVQLLQTLSPSLEGNTIPILPGPSSIESTTTSLALTLGGGASVLLTDHLALDADLRVLHIVGDDDRNIGRFGVGVSYRF